MKLAGVFEAGFDFETARKGARVHKTPVPRFEWEKQYGTWFVYDVDSYDGAPDSDSRQTGQGKTKAEALEELYDELLDDKIYSKEILDKAVKAEQTKPDWKDQ